MKEIQQDERGITTVEYVIVLTCLTAGFALAIAAASPSLVTFFEVRVAWLSLPVP